MIAVLIVSTIRTLTSYTVLLQFYYNERPRYYALILLAATILSGHGNPVICFNHRLSTRLEEQGQTVQKHTSKLGEFTRNCV